MGKGRLLGVSGRIQVRSYDAKDGTKRYITEVVAEEVQFLDRNKSGQASNQSFGDSFDMDMTPVNDGEIPF
jgi:single-strand DNA-binding protein